MNKRFIIAVLLLAAMAGGFSFAFTAENNQKANAVSIPETGVTVNKKISHFSLAALDGTKASVGTQATVPIINFWATWCPPCREEMPELNNFVHKYQSSLAFYAVNIQEPKEKVAAFISQHKYEMPVLLDTDGTVARMFRINAIPTTIVVDKMGVIKFRKAGTVTLPELESIIHQL